MANLVFYYKQNIYVIIIALDRAIKLLSRSFCSTSSRIKKIQTSEKHLQDSQTYVGVKACSFIKKRLQHSYFIVNIAKFLRISFL